MDPQLLGIDIGGSMTKAAVFDTSGRLLAEASARSLILADTPGHAERDPEAIWTSAVQSIRQVLGHPAVIPEAVAGIGVTGFGNGLFMVDADGRPTRPGIASLDSRAAGIVGEWRAAGLEDLMWDATLQPFWSGQPLPLLEWVRRHDPDALDRARRILACKDILRLRLTGSGWNDRTDLGSGGLFNPLVGRPAYELFEAIGLGQVGELLPEDGVAKPAQIVGVLAKEAAEATGLPIGVPVVAGATDNLSALLGSGVTEAGGLSVIGGTWSINQALSSAHVTDRSVFQSFGSHRDDLQVLVESSPNSMSNFDWYVRNFVGSDGRSAASLYAQCDERLLAQESAAGDAVTFLPHLYGSPRHPLRTAAVFGLTADVGANQVLRAVYEGIVFEHRTLIERLPGVAAGAPARVAGGVLRSPAWLQLFADVLDRAVETPDTEEVGARGAAMIAAVGTGLYPDYPTASAHMTRIAATYLPRPWRVDQLAERYQRYRVLRELTASLLSSPPSKPVPGAT